MTALDGVGGVPAAARYPRAPMTGHREERGHRFYVRLVRVSEDGFGGHVWAGQSVPKKCLRTGPIALVPQQYLKDLPVLINGTVEVEFLLAPGAEYFLARPLPADPPPVQTQHGGQPRAKRLPPVQRRAGRDLAVTLGSHPHDLGGRERQAAVPAHGPQDHVRGPAVPGKYGGSVGGELPATGAAVVALAASGIIAIAFRRWVPTRRARAHGCRVSRAPGDFTNSASAVS
jgi:hypothetical protein